MRDDTQKKEEEEWTDMQEECHESIEKNGDGFVMR